jgi:hypothetical protein
MYSLANFSKGELRLIRARDDLVDNFSTHKEEVEKILSEGVKKVNLNGR